MYNNPYVGQGLDQEIFFRWTEKIQIMATFKHYIDKKKSIDTAVFKV